MSSRYIVGKVFKFYENLEEIFDHFILNDARSLDSNVQQVGRVDSAQISLALNHIMCQYLSSSQIVLILFRFRPHSILAPFNFSSL